MDLANCTCNWIQQVIKMFKSTAAKLIAVGAVLVVIYLLYNKFYKNKDEAKGTTEPAPDLNVSVPSTTFIADVNGTVTAPTVSRYGRDMNTAAYYIPRSAPTAGTARKKINLTINQNV